MALRQKVLKIYSRSTGAILLEYVIPRVIGTGLLRLRQVSWSLRSGLVWSASVRHHTATASTTVEHGLNTRGDLKGEGEGVGEDGKGEPSDKKSVLLDSGGTTPLPNPPLLSP